MSEQNINFDTDVIEASGSTPVLVDFWAPWCGPCRALGPVLEGLAEKHAGRWKLVKLNTEEQPDIAARYGIRSIPDVKLFVEGEVADGFTGALPESAIESWLAKVLPSPQRQELERAEALLKNQETDAAQEALQNILAKEPDNQKAQALLGLAYLSDDYEEAVASVENIGQNSDYFDIADSIRQFARLFRMADGAEPVPEGPAKQTYIEGIESLRKGEYESAVERFIDVIRRDRKYDDDGARKNCIAIFKYLGEDHEISRRHRSAFSTALYV